jgi:hypothetical protein
LEKQSSAKLYLEHVYLNHYLAPWSL